MPGRAFIQPVSVLALPRLALICAWTAVLACLPPAWAAEEFVTDPGSDWQSKFKFSDDDEGVATANPPITEEAQAPASPAQSSENSRQITGDIAIMTAQYLREHHSPLKVAALMLAEQARHNIKHADGMEAQRVIAAYANASLYDRASYLESKLASGWKAAERNQFWLEQASRMLSRDEPRQAEQALRKLGEKLDPVLTVKRDSLLQLSYLAQGRFDAAINNFEVSDGDPQLALQAYHNYATALYKQGRKDEALALLDELGEVSVVTNEMLALRDYINLGLAWVWLSENQGGTARAVFKRVGLERAFSSRALLGLGWAELAPDGRRQDTRFRRKLNCVDSLSQAETAEERLARSLSPCKPIQTAPLFKYYRQFDYEAGGVGPDRVRRALVPWQVLVQRGTHDPAVQEALLAIAYAQTRLKRYEEAGIAYRQAIQRYDVEIQRLDVLLSEFQKPATDPQGLLERQAQPAEFAELRSSRAYAAAADELNDLLAASFELSEIQRSFRRESPGNPLMGPLSGPFWGQHEQLTRQVRARRAELNARISQMCADDTKARRIRLKKYLAGASLGLAKLYDVRGK